MNLITIYLRKTTKQIQFNILKLCSWVCFFPSLDFACSSYWTIRDWTLFRKRANYKKKKKKKEKKKTFWLKNTCLVFHSLSFSRFQAMWPMNVCSANANQISFSWECTKLVFLLPSACSVFVAFMFFFLCYLFYCKRISETDSCVYDTFRWNNVEKKQSTCNYKTV